VWEAGRELLGVAKKKVIYDRRKLIAKGRDWGPAPNVENRNLVLGPTAGGLRRKKIAPYRHPGK